MRHHCKRHEQLFGWQIHTFVGHLVGNAINDDHLTVKVNKGAEPEIAVTGELANRDRSLARTLDECACR